MILGAAYMLYLYRRVIFGVITRDDVRAMVDLTRAKVAIFAPMIAVVLWMGVYPDSFLRPMQPTLAEPHRITSRRPSAPHATYAAAEVKSMPVLAAPDFLPALPEMFLGCAAMALLLLGAHQGDRAAREIAWLAVAALAVTAALVLTPLGAQGPRARWRSSACS